jgi:carbamoyl-phosphate synthase large subunit
MTQPVSVVIGSAGRRLYLIRWFQEAFELLGVEGNVIVTEGDPSSAAFSAGDQGVLMPSYSDPAYETTMLEMVEDLRPSMFFSVNDYELAKLGNGLDKRLRARGLIVPGIAGELIDRVTDKFLMADFLQNAGIPTPRTVLASDSAGVRELTEGHDRVVVKHRHGSGSSGLAITDSANVQDAMERAAHAVSGGSHCRELDAVVVQPFVAGEEFGVDVVGTFGDAQDRQYTALARRKMRMRAGETDKAVSVDPRDFAHVGTKLGELLEPQGLIDVDVLRGSDGSLQVIDINPRFGGGYPFVHLAGANVPLMYVASMLGRPLENSWATYESGIVSAKFEEARVSGSIS